MWNGATLDILAGATRLVALELSRYRRFASLVGDDNQLQTTHMGDLIPLVKPPDGSRPLIKPRTPQPPNTADWSALHTACPKLASLVVSDDTVSIARMPKKKKTLRIGYRSRFGVSKTAEHRLFQNLVRDIPTTMPHPHSTVSEWLNGVVSKK